MTLSAEKVVIISKVVIPSHSHQSADAIHSSILMTLSAEKVVIISKVVIPHIKLLVLILVFMDSQCCL